MLLEAGADPRLGDRRHGWTALHLGVIHDQIESVREILRRRPGDQEVLEAASVTGVRPLLGASASRNPAMAAALLDAGADINAGDENGITALRQAVQNSDLTVIKLLLSRSARTDVPSKDGLSLLDTARLLEKDEIIECLRSHSAK